MTVFKELNLRTGDKLQMTIDFESKKYVYYPDLIGYVEGDYLLIKIPFEDGSRIQVWKGQRVHFQIFSGINIYKFSCTIKSVFTDPYNYMHVSFPNDIRSSALRNAYRVKANFPLKINGIETSSTINDISVSGAGIVADEKLGELSAELAVSFHCPIILTNQVIPIKTSIRICKIQEMVNDQDDVSTKWLHGVVFLDISQANKVVLQNFVYESLHRIV